MEVVASVKTQRIIAPVLNASADLFQGALLMPGVTAETDDGVLINATATSNADCLGILLHLKDDSAADDPLVAGTVPWFFLDTANGRTEIPSYPVELVVPANLCYVAYDDVDIADVASVSGTTTTITSLEDNIDTGFLYAQAGTGIGQIEFIDTSASGSCTMQTAFATALDSTTDVLKILPLFHRLLKWDIATATDFTKIGSDAAAGTGRAIILETHIIRNGLDQRLDPHIHGGLTALNSLAQFEIYALVALQDSMLAPVD